VQLNFADVLPDGNFMVLNAKKYADSVAAATAGEVAINIRAGGSLGFKGPEQMRAVRDGLVPMADILTTQQIGDEAMFGTEAILFLVAAPTARPAQVPAPSSTSSPPSSTRSCMVPCRCSTCS
jgi:TRAP-type C4-dicarboxylate transport system substrate-binding protein